MIVICYIPECIISIIDDGFNLSKSFKNVLAYPRYAFGANTHSVEK